MSEAENDLVGKPVGSIAFQLASVQPEHYRFLSELLTSETIGRRFKLRGATPSPERFAAILWDSVLVQKLIVDPVESRIYGLAQLYNYHSTGRNAYAAVVATPEALGRGVVLAGLVSFLDQAFNNFDLQKIYLEAYDFNVPQFAGLDRHATLEGTLRQHERLDGIWWDLNIWAIYRDDWESLRDLLGRFLL